MVTGGYGYTVLLGDALKFNSAVGPVDLLIPWQKRVFSSCSLSTFQGSTVM